ncbi:MAG: PQQ-binding-like beta-propeller repeat protein [Gammaproteobacteria bacterium]|nr:PQQ-binding-like beta-propeller repeat protein [Gammaproteobacteria bacterium]
MTIRVLLTVVVSIGLVAPTVSQGVGDGPVRLACPNYRPGTWASVHADCRNSDFSPVNTRTDLAVAWTALDGAALINPGTVDVNGRHFVTSARGPGTSHLHAFDARGRLIWESAPQRSLADLDSAAGFNAPVIDAEGDIYVGDIDQLWAFHAGGEQKWVAKLPVPGEPFVYQVITKTGHVGGITVGGDLALYRRADGELAVPVFSLPRGVAPTHGPDLPGLWGGALMDDSVRELFKQIAFGYGVQVANAPAVDPVSGRIFITAAGPRTETGLSGYLYGIDVGNAGASIAIVVPMSGGSGTSPALSPDARVVYSAGGGGDMFAVDTQTGAIRWRSRGEGLLSPAIGPDGTIYTGDIFGTPTVIALHPADGSQRWGGNYDDYAATRLPRLPAAPPAIPTGEPIARLVSVVSVSANAVWVGLAFGYEFRQSGSGLSLIIPHQNAVCALQPSDGRLINCVTVRDSLEAMIGIDASGRLFASHAAIFSSTFYYGLNKTLPARYRLPEPPAGGLSVLSAEQ